jgi:serine/threonine-protein kinase SRPK3
MDFLHRRCQIIHTDLKPENILVELPLELDDATLAVKPELVPAGPGAKPKAGGAKGKGTAGGAKGEMTAEQRKKLKKKMKKKQQKAKKKVGAWGGWGWGPQTWSRTQHPPMLQTDRFR